MNLEKQGRKKKKKYKEKGRRRKRRSVNIAGASKGKELHRK